MQARSTIHLWLSGAALLAAWLLVFVVAAVTVGSCDYDCGDNGGRAAFLGLVASAPAGALGLTLFVLGAGGTRGALKPLTWMSVAGGALIALIALYLVVHAIDQLIDAVTGNDLHFIGREGYERSQMRTEAAFSAVAAVVLAPIAASGVLPALAARSATGSRRWARRELVLLVILYVAFALGSAVSAIGEIEFLPFALVGLVTAAGAALAFAELGRRPGGAY